MKYFFVVNLDKLCWVSTVVGSFPRLNSLENMHKAFVDQIEAGIDYPCYPQLISMIDQFLDPLSKMESGLVKRDGKYYLEEDLKIPNEPIALEYGKFVLDYFKNNPEMKQKLKGWKACLTGPFTLAGEIIVKPEMVENKNPIVYKEPRAIMSSEIVLKIAQMMSNIAQAYDEMGTDIISMDEPTLALLVGKRKIFFHEEDSIIEILNKAIKPITKFSSVHVCGRVSPKLRDILLNSNVRIMDHEFANGSNSDVFEKKMFERENKTLAYGVLETNVKQIENGILGDYVETSDIMEKRIKKAMDDIGSENLIFKPDCGFRGLLSGFGEKFASEIVKEKLKIMCDSMNKLKP